MTAQLGAQLGEFFTAPQAIPVQPPPVSVDDEGVTTAPDFHSLLAQLHGVPGVLMPLRLAFDISAPWPAGVAVPSAIKLAISITVDPSVTIATPFVAVEDLSMTDGFLSPALWTPVEFDVSSAAHNMAQTPGAPAPRNNANRSAGFTLLRLPLNGGSSAIADLQTWSARVAGLGDSPAAPFEHGDFVRGYRVDVLDQARGVWRSLCQVTGSLARGGATLAIAGESAVTPVAATDSGGTIRANDTIARWLGWSLSAAAPGAATPGPSAATTFTTFALALAVTPGTLPPLRFGHTYSFRIRNVDVLGGGLALGDVADQTGASPAVSFLRLEPAPPPLMVFGTTAQPGESPAQLVVLSGPSITMPVITIRYLIPSACSTEIALMHGVLDTQWTAFLTRPPPPSYSPGPRGAAHRRPAPIR